MKIITAIFLLSLFGTAQAFIPVSDFATLGNGAVIKKSGEQHDVTNVNRDLNNTQEITLDQQTAGLDATVTVDHRLLSEGGRNAIKEDIQTSVEAVEQATNYVVTEIKVMGDNLPEELRGSLGKTGEELVESLIRQGLSKEQIKEFLANDNLLLGLSGVEQSNQELNGTVVSFSPVITDSTNSSIEPVVVSYQPDDTSNNDPIILDTIVVIGVGNDPTVLQVGVDGLGRIQQEIDKLRENNPSAATAIETAMNIATGGPLKAAVGQAVNYGIEQTLGDSISQVTNQITEYAASLVQNTDLAEFRDGTAYERDTGDLGDLGVSYTGTQDGIRLGATLLGIGGSKGGNGQSSTAAQSNNNGSGRNHDKAVLTNSQAKEIANQQGFTSVGQNAPKRVLEQTRGNPVYFDSKTNSYYSPDRGGHRADNAWKRFDRNGNRESGYFDQSGDFIRVGD